MVPNLQVIVAGLCCISSTPGLSNPKMQDLERDGDQDGWEKIDVNWMMPLMAKWKFEDLNVSSGPTEEIQGKSNNFE